MISVIVPIYNSSKYLRECIDSILCQTFKNFELLLVDDGSSDNSLDICKSYKDKRIRIIELKVNKGLSNARNVGIENANSEYICFIDSDDVLSEFYLEKMIYYMNDDVSFVECDFLYFDEIRNIKVESNNEVKIFNKNNYSYRLYSKNGVRTCVAWNKLYRKSLFKDLKYENVCNEDEFLIISLINKSKKIVVLNDKLYYYRIRKDSMQRTISEDRIKVLDVFEERKKIFKDEKFLYLNYLGYLDRIIYLYCVFYKYKKYNVCDELLKKFIKEYDKNKKFNIKRKIKYLLFAKFSKTFVKILLLGSKYTIA